MMNSVLHKLIEKGYIYKMILPLTASKYKAVMQNDNDLFNIEWWNINVCFK